MMEGADRILRDPVHGDVPLTDEEMRVLDTPEMQRLRHVRQLGVTYLVYPGAQHARFEHSVGTAHLVGLMVEGIERAARRRGATSPVYDRDALRTLRLAALVHDATHLPFGHNIEDQTGLLPRHDRPERFAWLLSDETELGRLLGELGARDEVLSVLAPEAVGREAPSCRRELVSGTIDADLLDYLARDALFTGLRLGYDPRIFGVFEAEGPEGRLFVDLGRQGYLKEAVLSEIVRCLEARFYFSERVYYHHAKISAGVLVAKAVEIALLEGALSFEDLQRATDAGLLERLHRIEVRDPERRRRMAAFLEALARRRLPKRVAVYPAYANPGVQEELVRRFFGAGSADERRRVEEGMTADLARRVGEEVPMTLYCPAGHMQLKQARILVRWPGREDLAPLHAFRDEVPRLEDLERSYARSWKFYVHALSDRPAVLRHAAEVAAEWFPEARNVLAPPGAGVAEEIRNPGPGVV